MRRPVDCAPFALLHALLPSYAAIIWSQYRIFESSPLTRLFSRDHWLGAPRWLACFFRGFGEDSGVSFALGAAMLAGIVSHSPSGGGGE